MSYSRNNVTMHRDGYADPLPAVNVKIYTPLARRDAEEVARMAGADARKLGAFVRDMERGKMPEWVFEQSCDSGWCDIKDDAINCFGHGVKVWQQGRSGGWCVVDGLPPIETWDAIMLGKWWQFERWVKQTVEARGFYALDVWYHNVWDEEYSSAVTPPEMTARPM